MALNGSLRIAWLGGAPVEVGGAPGVVTDLLEGLAMRGHRIDCFFPGEERELPARLASYDRLTFVWGTSGWRWNRWYSRGKVAAFASGLLSRAVASLRLRKEIIRRHRQDPYDLIYQNQSIESLGVPSGVARAVPFVIRPDTHIAGELRCLIAERKLSLRCQPAYIFALVASIMLFRAVVQRIMIRRASLLICISSVFRDHIVHDYRFPLKDTVIVQNPVHLERFVNVDRPLGEPPVVLVASRIAVRKGIEDVVAVARALLERDVNVRIRIVGGPSLFSDYRTLLDHLPPENSEYVGVIPHFEMPREYARSDVLLQASKYEPFGLTVAEALAAGVPVVATSEVGAIEDVDRWVAAEVEPGDVDGMATAIMAMLDRLRSSATETRSLARAEAERLFAPDVVCEKLSLVLEHAVHDGELSGPSSGLARNRGEHSGSPT